MGDLERPDRLVVGLAPEAPAPSATTIEIVVPVYNEERVLDRSILTLRSYLDRYVPFAVTVTIADNASTDGTWQVATRLAEQHRGIRAVHLARKGRGRALRSVWSTSRADVVAYMDVDLSTDLNALLPLLAPLVSGHSDVAIGSRLARDARVARGAKREVISRSYNSIIGLGAGRHFSDAQCGFKALTATAAARLLPEVKDDGWFFDTELLLLAERHHLRVHEVPVDWTDDPDSRVALLSTAWADVRGLGRVSGTQVLGRAGLTGLVMLLVVLGAVVAGVSGAGASLLLAAFLVRGVRTLGGVRCRAAALAGQKGSQSITALGRPQAPAMTRARAAS